MSAIHARLLAQSDVAVEKVRDRNAFLAAIIAAVEFFLSPQLSGSFHSRQVLSPGVQDADHTDTRVSGQSLSCFPPRAVPTTTDLHFLDPTRS